MSYHEPQLELSTEDVSVQLSRGNLNLNVSHCPPADGDQSAVGSSDGNSHNIHLSTTATHVTNAVNNLQISASSVLQSTSSSAGTYLQQTAIVTSQQPQFKQIVSGHTHTTTVSTTKGYCRTGSTAQFTPITIAATHIENHHNSDLQQQNQHSQQRQQQQQSHQHYNGQQYNNRNNKSDEDEFLLCDICQIAQVQYAEVRN